MTYHLVFSMSNVTGAIRGAGTAHLFRNTWIHLRFIGFVLCNLFFCALFCLPFCRCSLGHCIVCPSNYSFGLPLWYPQDYSTNSVPSSRGKTKRAKNNNYEKQALYIVSNNIVMIQRRIYVYIYTGFNGGDYVNILYSIIAILFLVVLIINTSIQRWTSSLKALLFIFILIFLYIDFFHDLYSFTHVYLGNWKEPGNAPFMNSSPSYTGSNWKHYSLSGEN